jgi:hypothetical protein
VKATAESPGTVEEDGRADLQQRIGNGKDPPVVAVYYFGASRRPFDNRRFQRSPGLSSSPKT